MGAFSGWGACIESCGEAGARRMNDDTTDGDSRPISRTAAFGILACVLPLALLFGPLLIAL